MLSIMAGYLSNRDLWEPYVLHDCPDDSEATRLRRKGIDLVGAAPHIAEKALDGIGGADIPMHHLGKIVKGQQMCFVFPQTADRFGILRYSNARNTVFGHSIPSDRITW